MSLVTFFDPLTDILNLPKVAEAVHRYDVEIFRQDFVARKQTTQEYVYRIH